MAATRLYSDDETRRFGRWKSDCWRRYVYAARDAVCNLAAAISRVHVATESQPSAAAVGASLSAIAAPLGLSRDANHATKLRCIVQLVTAVLKKTTDRGVMVLWAKPACEILALAFVALGRTEGQHPDDRKRVSTTG